MVVISLCFAKLITPVVIATSETCHFSWFLQLPSFHVAYLTGLQQLQKYQLGVWVAPTTNLSCELPVLVLTIAVKTSIME